MSAAEAVLSGYCCVAALTLRGVGPCGKEGLREQVRKMNFREEAFKVQTGRPCCEGAELRMSQGRRTNPSLFCSWRNWQSLNTLNTAGGITSSY